MVKIRISSVLMGLVFAGIFSAGFYVVGTTLKYSPLKLPAALPFLISDKTSSIADGNDITGNTNVDDTTPADADAIAANPFANSQKLLKLDKQIRDAGIPIEGVALVDGKTHEIKISFKDETTDQQKAQTQQIADSFDWTITAKDIFDATKATQEIMQQFPVERLALMSSYMPMINYFLTQKDFSKLKGFLNSLYSQSAISQDDYTSLADVLAGQKIYLNPHFVSAPVDQPPAVESPPPVIDEAPAPTVPESTLEIIPESTPEVTPEPLDEVKQDPPPVETPAPVTVPNETPAETPPDVPTEP